MIGSIPLYPQVFRANDKILNNRQDFTYLVIHAMDVDHENLKQHFATCIEFIDKGKETGKVLVHWYVLCCAFML